MPKIREEKYLDFGSQICNVQSRFIYKKTLNCKKEKEKILLIGAYDVNRKNRTTIILTAQ